ncbi:YceI family protein [Mucilaginibacter sp.]|uniref:YceI family protein n=1 Tax=Mucilaginibacter sp. TaxID=1882438 RepID=UPI003265FBF5
MRKAFFAIALLIISVTAFGQVKNNVTKSSITFKIKNLGINTGGKIGVMQANVSFDPAKLASSKIDAVADMTTITTDNEMRDNHIKNENYFDVVKYPKITMSSVSFTRKNTDNYIGKFNITIKDKTKVIDVPFSYITNATTAYLNGSFKISRADFGIGGSTMTLADEATINVEVETAK